MSYEDQVLELELQIKGLTAPRVTSNSIDNKIKSSMYHQFPGTNTTVCCLTLENGYTVVGHSACASDANFDKNIGERLAYDHAKNQIWALEGYVLKEHLYNTKD